MTDRDWIPGTLIAAQLSDGRRYTARLLAEPWVAFYDGSDDGTASTAEIRQRSVHRSLAVHKSVWQHWQPVGLLDPTRTGPQPRTFVQSELDPSDLCIADAEGNLHPASAEQCFGLEALAVWEPGHLADMLLAHARGDIDPWTAQLALIDPTVGTCDSQGEAT